MSDLASVLILILAGLAGLATFGPLVIAGCVHLNHFLIRAAARRTPVGASTSSLSGSDGSRGAPRAPSLPLGGGR